MAVARKLSLEMNEETATIEIITFVTDNVNAKYINKLTQSDNKEKGKEIILSLIAFR
jgi:hypothetical protein